MAERRLQYGQVPYGPVGSGLMKELKRTELAVYLVLAAHADRQFRCSPSVRRVAVLVGRSERQVQRALARLRQAGLVGIKTGGGRDASTYELLATGDAKNVGGTELRTGDIFEHSPRHPSSPAVTLSNVRGDAKEVTQTTEQQNNKNSLPGKRIDQADLTLFDGHGEHGQRRAIPSRSKLPRKTDPIWDTVTALFNLPTVTASQKGRVGKLVVEFKAMGATPDDIRIRAERYRLAWPKVTCTPEALAKHWSAFATEQPSIAQQQSNPARITASKGKYAGVTKSC